jgi:Family of unknown function (DUF6152)
MRTRLATLVLCVSMSLSPTVFAHHAFSSEFDANKPVKIKGTVSRIEWINPHSWIHVDVKEADGKITKWMVEGGSPNALIRRGVTAQLLKVGMEVVVDGYQAKDGSNRANGRDITLADGRKLSVGSAGTGAPGDTPEK